MCVSHVMRVCVVCQTQVLVVSLWRVTKKCANGFDVGLIAVECRSHATLGDDDVWHTHTHTHTHTSYDVMTSARVEERDTTARHDTVTRVGDTCG